MVRAGSGKTGISVDHLHEPSVLCTLSGSADQPKTPCMSPSGAEDAKAVPWAQLEDRNCGEIHGYSSSIRDADGSFSHVNEKMVADDDANVQVRSATDVKVILHHEVHQIEIDMDSTNRDNDAVKSCTYLCGAGRTDQLGAPDAEVDGDSVPLGKAVHEAEKPGSSLSDSCPSQEDLSLKGKYGTTLDMIADTDGGNLNYSTIDVQEQYTNKEEEAPPKHEQDITDDSTNRDNDAVESCTHLCGAGRTDQLGAPDAEVDGDGVPLGKAVQEDVKPGSSLSDSCPSQEDLSLKGEYGTTSDMIADTDGGNFDCSTTDVLEQYANKEEEAPPKHEEDITDDFQHCKERHDEHRIQELQASSEHDDPGSMTVMESTSSVDESQAKGNQIDEDHTVSDSHAARRDLRLQEKLSLDTNTDVCKAEANAILQEQLGFVSEKASDLCQADVVDPPCCNEKPRDSILSTDPMLREVRPMLREVRLNARESPYLICEPNDGKNSRQGECSHMDAHYADMDMKDTSDFRDYKHSLFSPIRRKFGGGEVFMPAVAFRDPQNSSMNEMLEGNLPAVAFEGPDNSSMYESILEESDIRLADRHMVDLREILGSWEESSRDQASAVRCMIKEQHEQYAKLYGMAADLERKRKHILSLGRRLKHNHEKTLSAHNGGQENHNSNHSSAHHAVAGHGGWPRSIERELKSHNQRIHDEIFLWKDKHVRNAVQEGLVEIEQNSLIGREDLMEHIMEEQLEQDRILLLMMEHLEKTQRHVAFLKRRLLSFEDRVRHRWQGELVQPKKQSNRQVEVPMINTLDGSFKHAIDHNHGLQRRASNRRTSCNSFKPETNEAIRNGFNFMPFDTLMQTLGRLLETLCSSLSGFTQTQEDHAKPLITQTQEDAGRSCQAIDYTDAGRSCQAID
ncbi:hypothetical protein KP509_07G043700 [Ceratopteris richardii]|nr:hypothetical protein KP509_07G043700 [Ceratopteris richardii]